MFYIRRSASYGMFATFKEPNRIRSLFTQDALGITAYLSNRKLEFKYMQKPEEFKVEFKKCIDQHLPSHIILDNLKRFVHIMDDTFSDLNLLESGLRLYCAQRSQMQSRDDDLSKNYYEFGPIVMRAFYHFGLLNQAIEFFENPQLGPLFKQITTFEILLDWLYDRKRYEMLLELNESMVQWLHDQKRYPSAVMNSIVTATYFQLANPKHHQLAFELYQRLKENGTASKQYRKTFALIAEMKRKDQHPEECLEILAPHNNIDVNIRYVKTLAYLDLNQFDEVFRLIRMTIDSKLSDRKNVPKIPIELLHTIEERLAKNGMDVHIEEYQKIYKQLKQFDLTMSKPLNHVLCARFSSNVMTTEKRKRYRRFVPEKLQPNTL